MSKSQSPVSVMTRKARLMAAKEGNARANDKVAHEYIWHDVKKPYAIRRVECSPWDVMCRKLDELPHYRFKWTCEKFTVKVWSVQAETEIVINWNGEVFQIKVGKILDKSFKYPDQVIAAINDCARFMWRGELALCLV